MKKLRDIVVLENTNKDFEVSVLVTEKKVRIAKNGNKYIDFRLQDSSLIKEAKYWDYESNEKLIDSIDAGDIIKIKFSISEYQDKAQININEIEKISIEDVNIDDFVLTSDWNFEKMKEGLEFFRKKIKTPHLGKLIDKMIFSDEYFNVFSIHPAATIIHHNYYHGLLQHTLEVLKFAYTVGSTKKLSKRQLERLIVMSMLHDWGKIIEYKYLPSIEYSDEGKMLGHIFLGTHTALNIINEIEDFDKDDKLIILNGILSHHGYLEFGSPVLPKTIEAQILHQADMMSCKAETIIAFIKDQENEKDSFTPKLWNTGSCYYKEGV